MRFTIVDVAYENLGKVYDNRPQVLFFAMSSRRNDAIVTEIHIGKADAERAARRNNGCVRVGCVRAGYAETM
jgi:hypothetical protein